MIRTVPQNSADGPPVPCVVYAAKSTDDLHGSIPTQIADCVAAIVAAGGRELVAEEHDEAVSAYSQSRGGGVERAWEHAERAARDHGHAELWVQHSDRLARGDGATARHLVEHVLRGRKVGVVIRSVQDDSSGESVLLAAVMGERNFEDSRRKSEAVRSGKRRQFDRGERLGGPVPDGFVGVPVLEDGRRALRCELDPLRAPVLRRMFELADAGIAAANVARRLHEEGLRTKTGGAFDRRRVQDTLSNPFYAGRVARNRTKAGAVVEARRGSHPALVAGDVFDRVQALTAARDRAKSSNRKPGRPYSRHALAGLTVCARCGSKMRAAVSGYKRRDGTQARTYTCDHVKRATGLCDAPIVNAGLVDGAVVAHLEGFFVDFGAWVRSATDHDSAQREAVQRSLDAERSRLETAVRQYARVRDRWTAAIDAGDDSTIRHAQEALDDLAGKREQAKHRITRLEEVLADCDAGVSPADAILDRYDRLARAVRGALDAAESLRDVNAELAGWFARFELDTLPDGVRLAPVLRDDVIGEVACDSPFEDPTVPRPGPGASAEEWRAAIEDAGPPRTGRVYLPRAHDEPVAAADGASFEPAGGPAAFPTIATGAEQIVPPVLPVDVPYGQPGNIQAPGHRDRGRSLLLPQRACTFYVTARSGCARGHSRVSGVGGSALVGASPTTAESTLQSWPEQPPHARSC